MIPNAALLGMGRPRMLMMITQAEKLMIRLTAQPPEMTVIIGLHHHSTDNPTAIDLIFSSPSDLVDFAQRLMTAAGAAQQDLM